MGSIQVAVSGFLTTVQDLGRYGYAHFGVSPGGAADALGLRVGNMLVGNPEDAAALEMTLVGGEFFFSDDSVVAITGSDFHPSLDGSPAPRWRSFQIKRGSRLRFSATTEGARCYLCVRGGIEAPKVLGSASTHLLTGLGGIEGRGLRKGDEVVIGSRVCGSTQHDRRVSREFLSYWEERKRIRVTAGPQAEYFTEEAREQFLSARFEVTEESNRMGLRLGGPSLERAKTEELLTEGVSLGAVQVPPSGQPILLFVEHPTTGGYPKIANVVLADLHRVGQLRPRDALRFEMVSLDEAARLLHEQEVLLATRTLEPV